MLYIQRFKIKFPTDASTEFLFDNFVSGNFLTEKKNLQTVKNRYLSLPGMLCGKAKISYMFIGREWLILVVYVSVLKFLIPPQNQLRPTGRPSVRLLTLSLSSPHARTSELIFNWRTMSFSIGRLQRNLRENTFFSRTTGPISTKFVTKHFWKVGIQFYSSKGPCWFPMRDTNEIAKKHWRNLEIFF